MCLAIPARVERIADQTATVELAGNRVEVVTALTPEVKVDDWVLVHAGYTITVLDEKDARETFAVLKQMEQT